MNTYVAVTPARDEEKFLPRLIACMSRQNYPPGKWLIIDDGSTDATGRIIDEAAREYPWIEPHHLPRRTGRSEGGESAVGGLLVKANWEQYDFILRLDADLGFGPQFVRLLMAEFARDPRLGIAGPTLYEPSGSSWHEVPMPGFHTRGAVKLYSAACLSAIGGLEAGLGWDTIDEAGAMMLGFRSQNFRYIRAYHYRPQGAANGQWKGRLAAGQAAYQVGYSPLFMLARALRRSLEQPFLVGGALLMLGYLEGYLLHKKRAASRELVKFVRREQHRRLLLMESLWR